MKCENAKVGDKVIVHSGGMMNYQEVREITGETPKQWIVDGDRYWKKDGGKVGYRRGFISPVEKEDPRMCDCGHAGGCHVRHNTCSECECYGFTNRTERMQPSEPDYDYEAVT